LKSHQISGSLDLVRSAMANIVEARIDSDNGRFGTPPWAGRHRFEAHGLGVPLGAIMRLGEDEDDGLA
jgi:hypothetical protein